jgi:SAM-dependent methyltransferase
MKKSSEVKEFYDEFSKRVLVRDFYYINLRHEAIKSLCKRFVSKGSTILEIGCGVGILSKFIQKLSSRVLGVDISEKNVEIAREFAGSAVCRFEVLDVVENGSELENHGKFDVVLMADVIEHIPKERYPELFGTIERALSDTGRVILTFPSPEVQAFMTANKPDDMQVIDESVELDDILRATSLKLLYFAYRHIFGKNDYVHVVLSTDRSFSETGKGQSTLGWLLYRLRKYRWRLGNLAFVRRLKRKGLAD